MAVGYNPRIVTDGLVLALDAGNTKSYPGSGTTWTDFIGSNNGTLTNGPTYSSDDGGAIVFDGSNDYISFISNPSLTNQVTFETWVKLSPTSPNETGEIFSRQTFDTGSYRMLYSSSSFSWVCATTNNSWYTAGTYVGDTSVTPYTQVYQVVGTYDGSNNRIYVNGELKNTGANISGNILTTGTFYLMRKRATNTDHGKGNIYSHRIYNRALTASEVEQNYNALRGRFGI